MEATTLSEDNEHGKQYTMTEFIEYMSSNLLIVPSNPENHCVFWFQETDGHLPPPAATSTSMSIDQALIRERIKQGLQNITWYFWDSLLVQFWEPTIFNGRRFLTASRQPFALKTLYKGLSWYRKHCTNQDVLVDEGAKEEELWPLGRVFLNGQPESSPDLRFYSIKEYPLRDHALRCGVRRYMALPVFELQSNYCVGVLELVSFNTALLAMYFGLTHDVDGAFKKSNLRLLHMDGQSDTQTEGRKLALSEIKQMFTVVSETPNLPLAQAWIPCRGCSGNCNCMERALYTCDAEWNKQYELMNSDFLMACLFHKLQEGKGVAGRALSSVHKLCFCRSIYGFNITEYPLAHYARKAMLAVSFAICLQSAHTGSDPYVLEFFMLPGNQDDADPRSLIQSLLVRMTRQLLSFKVASGQQLGEELLVEIVRFRMDDEPVYFQKSPSDRYPLGFKVSESVSPPEAEQISPSDRCQAEPLKKFAAGGDVDSSTQAGNTSTVVTSLLGSEVVRMVSSERGRKRTSLQISYQELQSHFGKPEQEAADMLGVSRSTFKRVCRSYNISRWPFHIKNKANHSLFEVKSADKPGQDKGSIRVNCSGSNLSTQDLTKNPCSITVQDTSLVTIKANYQSKTVKFQLCISSGMANLEEEVAKRLKLKIGDFEMSYMDEDGSLILLSCDQDLWFCTKTLTSLGLTTIQVSVQSVSS
ncbi:hypothetical protein Pfo_006505 [Paulownia fortunei]|nr:hypothetical protein Pfo_006505 [Paulownia fortunei]